MAKNLPDWATGDFSDFKNSSEFNAYLVNSEKKFLAELFATPKYDQWLPSVALPDNCEEAHVASTRHYIPCNVPATMIVYHDRDDRQYRMCHACGTHNINSRGAHYIGPYRKATIHVSDDLR